ncbi:MAG: hypothetical protein ABSF00_04760 [Candidatus Bathyarchaeia archaeon]
MKAYLESSVVTDWLFLKTVEIPVRKRLGVDVKACLPLVDGIFQGRFKPHQFVFSWWTVLEAIHNYARSRAEFRMLLEELSLRYSERVRTHPHYWLSLRELHEVRTEITEAIIRGRKLGRLTFSSLPDWNKALPYVRMGFDAYDSLHLAIAIHGNQCTHFVTKDRDFTDSAKILKPFILIVRPQAFLNELRNSRQKVR